MTLEDIGEGDDGLLCLTDQTACCRPPYASAIGNWFFPNGTRVPSSGAQWDFHRTRGQSAVFLHHRRGGADGVYRCEIPNTTGVIQTIYIGVYTADTGEWYLYTLVTVYTCNKRDEVILLYVYGVSMSQRGESTERICFTVSQWLIRFVEVVYQYMYVG